jgi:hypothetical protein
MASTYVRLHYDITLVMLIVGASTLLTPIPL